jgi:hypothetical protein
MEAFIQYKRIEEKLSPARLQILFNELITDGFEIIYYNEIKAATNDVYGNEQLTVVIVAGKKQTRGLSNVL